MLKMFLLEDLSTKIATLLRGKHKVTYTPHIDNGDFVCSRKRR